jgi:HEAT repeat protein
MFGPLASVEHSTYSTPQMRIDAIREFASRSTGTDSEDQRKLTNQLARQIQIEPDPLVREIIIETIANFRTPLAQQVLQAGLHDEESAVRIASCLALGSQGDPGAVKNLEGTLRGDNDQDVRIAAAEGLGKIKTPDSIQALAIALEDRDPALQFVAVESLKSASGQDFGGDVRAWRKFATGQNPAIEERPVSIAEQIRKVNPF